VLEQGLFCGVLQFARNTCNQVFICNVFCKQAGKKGKTAVVKPVKLAASVEEPKKVCISERTENSFKLNAVVC